MAVSVSKEKCQKACITGIGVVLQYAEGCRKMYLFLYRIRAIQELKGSDSAKRLQCCSCFRFFVEENGIKILYVVYFSAEAWFYFDEYMRSHNCGNCHVKIYTHYIRRNWCMVCAVSQSLIWSYLL